ncbi:MAG: type II toxin-antitoxin system VapC family toxin [Actinobacteria bacterium]|nr:MAG: type II toxin-antitoxin system VapC family toxin [Actinomycetota bacterium]
MRRRSGLCGRTVDAREAAGAACRRARDREVSSALCVLDASVGVRVFRDEPGSAEARDLVDRHIRHEITIAVDTLFHYEVLRAASRDGGGADVVRVWRDLESFGLVTVPLGDELVSAAAVRSATGCAPYAAFSAGLADLREAPLYSADARAHGSHPRVRLVGA